ncbi:MAG TPA: hypothetical protein VED59_09780 [Acidimicrobiales bacterium]|nr:hypothetical protein [Acidimicrobiales bacterium]
MQHLAGQAVLAALSKHDDAGIVAVAAAVILLAVGVNRVIVKAAGAVLLPVLGVLAAIAAVLLFTRSV